MNLFNFRIQNQLKTKFQQQCKENHSTMSRELIEFIKKYTSDSRN